MFQTRTALVKHLISAEHKCLTALCPWCKEKKGDFYEGSDLEIHVGKSHTDLHLPKDRFSRANGFYFAIYPNDYAKIAENVTQYDSDAAYEVRKAVREWAEGFEDRKERIDKWNRGWKDGLKEAKFKNGDRHVDRRDVRRDSNNGERREGNNEGKKDGRQEVRRDNRNVERREGTSTDGRGSERKGENYSESREVENSEREENNNIGHKKAIESESSRKRKEDDSREERTAKHSISSEKGDGLDTYRDDIEFGTGEIEDEVGTKTIETSKSEEREDTRRVNVKERGDSVVAKDSRRESSEEVGGDDVEEASVSTENREQIRGKEVEAYTEDREKNNGGDYGDEGEDIDEPKSQRGLSTLQERKRHRKELLQTY